MALPASPPISFSQIKSEFGATGTRSLTEFYRGGSFVPNTPVNSSVPTSGSISLLDFLGASNYTPLSISATPVSVTAPAGTPTVTGQSITTVSGGSGSLSYTWTRLSGSSLYTGGTSIGNFGYSPPQPDGVATASYRVTVTDGTSSASDTISVRLQAGTPI